MVPDASLRPALFDDVQGLPHLKPYRAGQVTTHGHDRPIGSLLASWKSFADTMHRDNVPIPAGGSWSFDEIEGPGRIVNIWCTAMPPLEWDPLKEKLSPALLWRNLGRIRRLGFYHRLPELLQGVWIRIHFDGEERPCVDAPLGDFFGVGFGEYKHYTSQYLAMTDGGFICRFPMPFRKSARVTLVNTHPALAVPAFYGAVTYLQYGDERALQAQGYFHARYCREHPTSPDRPYLILDSEAMGVPDRPGHYVGVVLNTEATQARAGFAYLEGNTKIWVDGEDEPSLEYTGLEDYYQGAWYYLRTRGRPGAEFCAPYHGLTVRSLNRRGLLGTMLLAGWRSTRASQYRFHPEGIPFGQRIRVTSHHGEFDEIEGNYSSVAYWYQRH